MDEELYKLLLDSFHFAVIFIKIEDIDTNRFRIIYTSKQYLTVMNRDPDKTFGKLVDEVVSEANLQQVFEQYRRAIATKQTVPYIHFAPMPDKVKIFETKMIPCLGDGENVTHILVMAKEITDDYLAEEEFKAKHKWYETLTSSMADVVTEIDSYGIIHFASDSCPKVLGYTVEELIGKNAWDFIHNDDIEELKKMSVDKTLEDKTIVTTYRFRKKSGVYVWLETTTRKIPIGAAEYGFICVSRDVSDRKHVQDELQRKLEEIENLRKKLIEDAFNRS